MDLGQNDFERLLFFEHAREKAEAEYAKNPQDADNLTRWAGALMELSQFQDGVDCNKMIKEAVAKLEEALVVKPRKHDTLWCLGNAYTSQAFLSPDHEFAKEFFAKASQCFEQALVEDPGNELYMKSLELTGRAPQLHLEMQKQVINQQAPSAGASSSSAKAASKKKNSELKYDICGWIILAVGIVAWMGIAKSHIPPPQI